nr:hypothetical protein [uncultured Albidiferax sp.]
MPPHTAFTPAAWLAAAAALLLTTAALVFGGYQWGASATTTALTKQRDKAVATAQGLYQAEVTRGTTAVANLQTDLREQRGQYQNLEGKYLELRNRHAPLVVAARRPGPTAACAQASTTGPGQAIAPTAPTHPDVDPAAGAVDVLTRGAVWMWNASLSGDPDQPTGACGSADTSSAACDVATEITLSEAWDNHHTNAQLCAANRLQHQRLIDFLQGSRP